MAYADEASLTLYLGRALTSAEVAVADSACDAATDLVDRYTGRTWTGTVVAGELHTLFGRSLQLARHPVASVQTVTVRSALIGATSRTLAAGVDYELIDPTQGVLLLRAFWTSQPDLTPSGPLASVSYTVGASVPASVSFAATMLAARLIIQGSIETDTYGIRRVRIGDFDVQYQDAIKLGGSPTLPPDIAVLLNGYRRAVLFA